MLIRDASPDDAATVAAIYRPIVERTTISFELDAPDEAEMRSRIVEITRRYPWLVAVDDVSAYVDEAARQHSIGRTLYTELFARLAQAGTFHRAFAGIALSNDASIAFHQRFGFEPVGIYREVGYKFGRWIDVSWWQRGIETS
ncbi:MAG: N-acetyltransferase family protein [Candidatus Cybelea sp.]